MTNLNFLAVVVAAVVAFVVSSLWYIVFGAERAKLLGADPDELNKPTPWKMFVEMARTLALTAVFAGLAGQLGIVTWTGAILLGLSLWIGFPVLILSGSVLWENVSRKLAAIHAVATVVSLWR
jgi:hypothetical protein